MLPGVCGCPSSHYGAYLLINSQRIGNLPDDKIKLIRPYTKGLKIYIGVCICCSSLHTRKIKRPYRPSTKRGSRSFRGDRIAHRPLAEACPAADGKATSAKGKVTSDQTHKKFPS